MVAIKTLSKGKSSVASLGSISEGRERVPWEVRGTDEAVLRAYHTQFGNFLTTWSTYDSCPEFIQVKIPFITYQMERDTHEPAYSDIGYSDTV